MFTGIVEELGTVREAGTHRLVVGCTTVSADSDVGGSIAVNGVCLTVVARGADDLAFDLSDETLARSTLGRLAPGDPVNLERPVTLMARLGQFDACASIRRDDPVPPECRQLTIEAPPVSRSLG